VPDVYAAWKKWCATANERLRTSLPVVTDFECDAVSRTVEAGTTAAGAEEETSAGEGVEGEKEEQEQMVEPWGIHTLPVDYEPIKEYVAKCHDIFEFEREGDCVVCREALDAGNGLHAVCMNAGCEGVGHLECWSKHILASDNAETGLGSSILPIQGKCPKCGGMVEWVDMMKELTLRMRGGKEVDKLLKVKRKRVAKPKGSVVTKAKGKAA